MLPQVYCSDTAPFPSTKSMCCFVLGILFFVVMGGKGGVQAYMCISTIRMYVSDLDDKFKGPAFLSAYMLDSACKEKE